jgi:hypothetical protein
MEHARAGSDETTDDAVPAPDALESLAGRLAQLRARCGELGDREAGLARRELALTEREARLMALAARLRNLQEMLASGHTPVPEPAPDAFARIEELTRERDELRRRLDEQELRLKRAGLEIEWGLPGDQRRRKPR